MFRFCRNLGPKLRFYSKVSFKKNEKIPVKRSFKKPLAYFAVFAVGVTEFTYHFVSDPQLSIGDMWRRLLFGDPYRDYISLIDGSLVQNAEVTYPKDQYSDKSEEVVDASFIYTPLGRFFHLILTDEVVQPGLVFKEQYLHDVEGEVIARDHLANNVICKWRKGIFQIEDLGLTSSTPLHEILQALANDHYKSGIAYAKKEHNRPFVQRLEYVRIKNEKNPLPHSNILPQPLDPVEYYDEVAET
ncbi:ycf2, partial [Acrasis kona]